MSTFDEVYEELSQLQERIVKLGSKWQVQSEKGRNMGTYDTKEEAEKRLKQVEYFKHMNEAYDPCHFYLSKDDIYDETDDELILSGEFHEFKGGREKEITITFEDISQEYTVDYDHTNWDDEYEYPMETVYKILSRKKI